MALGVAMSYFLSIWCESILFGKSPTNAYIFSRPHLTDASVDPQGSTPYSLVVPSGFSC